MILAREVADGDEVAVEADGDGGLRLRVRRGGPSADGAAAGETAGA